MKKIFLSLILCFVLLFSGCGVFSSGGDSEQKLLHRAARTSDIAFSDEYDFPISVNFIIRPYYDIDDLEITINYIDTKGNTFKTEKKVIGSVLKGHEYKFQVKLTDFTFLEMFKLDSCTYYVSGGYVSYFA